MNIFKHVAIWSALLAFPVAVSAAGPTISTVSPVNATVNVPVTLSATVSSNNGISTCHLYVDLEDIGLMTVANGQASASFTFPYGGSRIAFVFCRDNGGAAASGPYTAIWVEGALQNQAPLQTPTPAAPAAPAAPETPVVPASTARSLMKLECAAGVAADDPCKAVYYIGADGKRHAFPNSKVYFTWYENFDAVQTVSPATLSSYALGKNVTYRPGSRMVKFATLNKVYAVATDGALRWVKTEEIASTLYGATWNTLVDDIPDTFYLNYSSGPDIDTASAYNPTNELAAHPTFD